MNNMRTAYILIFASVMTFSSLYAPQPIQPMIGAEFGISMSKISLLTTVTMIPLAIAPIFYGYLLESVSARRVLIFSLAFLSICQLLFYISNSFYLLVCIRFFEGCAIPAVLIGIMTYIADMSDKSQIQRNLAIYISSTIFGGFAGRFFSGILSHYFGWRMMFIVLGISLLAASTFIRNLPDNRTSVARINPAAAKEVLSDRRFSAVYLMVFFMFFMFAAVLNFIPFRMRQIDPESGELLIGVMYTGYISGIFVALYIMRIIKFLGSEMRAIYMGLSIFTFSLVFFFSEDILMMFFGMFVFCSGMFMAHSTAAGYANKLAEKNKAVTNGLYVAFYYSGGALGSVLPGFVYESYSWDYFLLLLACLMSSAIILGRIISKKAQ